ncbi:hypothetical protein [Dyadobacter tibetensis]|uniref:hypothetical protein n=1 Tax=Dyadobacter tibetensis TaxID=1211851 RepID=UPI000471E32F|nr:hypothetical protein [Dyadobacter tibetensis]
MKKLHENWLTDDLIDFEYKKYKLLAYLQGVEQQFQQVRLFPYLHDLRTHLATCQLVKGNKEAIRSHFPKRVKKLDLRNVEIVYEDLVAEHADIVDITELLDYAIPQLSGSLHRGNAVLEEVGVRMKLSPVGIEPMRTEEGYLFLQRNRNRSIYVYQYQLALFNTEQERYVKLNYVDQANVSIGKTVNQLKVSLTRRFSHLPNPATYIIESPVDYPIAETLLPVAQRLLLRHLSVS